MSVIRVKHQKNYVVINKTVLEDSTLSFKAKGLWAYCMSRPDDWTFHISHLITVSNDGEKAIYSALKELEDQGYLRRIQLRDQGKFKKYDYEISEIQIIFPQPQKRDAVKRRAVKEGLLSNDKNQVMKDTYSPSPSGAFDPPYTQEEEEFFSQRMREIPKPPKFISPQYKKKVIQSLHDQKILDAMMKRTTENHREQAFTYDGHRINGDMVAALKDRVEFTCGSQCIAVPYNLVDGEWKSKTKNWFKKT